ncbi:MAG TPA: alkaline phosphatase [Vicinamibacterales bacterium]|nr:alkaline phosphatase [Vicinamibacterales bacterium]
MVRRHVLRWVAGAGLLVVTACASSGSQSPRAENVILFLGDAGGIPTLSAASLHGYGEPRRLFIHQMPHLALAETSAASQWVTDSAAAMTAIVTGRKTHNGVVGQSDSAVRGKQDGEPLKTILEHAEERGLSTGLVTNSSVLSATPAACYAHVNDRRNERDIFRHLLEPRFGDGVDVVIGAGREGVMKAASASELSAPAALRDAGLELFDSLEAVPTAARRVAVLFDDDFDLGAAVRKAIELLSRNPRGFFLMVESDLHTQELVRGLDRALQLDRAVRETASRMHANTLTMFTADHSYDLRVHSGRKGSPLLPPLPPDFGDGQDSIRLDHVRRENDHTGEEVIVAAQGPGAAGVRGVLSNVDLFHIMMAAYGWRE